MSSIATKRLNKELKELLDPEKGPPVGIQVVNTDNLKTWVLTIEVLGESVYQKQGEVFALRFTFTDRYPMESPEVVFVVNEEFQAPLHPHVYSNGHKKERPADNDRYVRTAPLSPKQTRFHYDGEHFVALRSGN
ncbi:hypothetical protein FRC07_005293 [Ceratobasidium sp. 392]|nr:hypothetical protein FRC07_005293 [Ceratobasidium sp. 392]